MPDGNQSSAVIAETTHPLIFQKMPAILAEIGAVTKSGYNKEQGFKFRGIEAVYAAVHPLFAKHKVFMTAEVLNASRMEKPTKSGGMRASTVLRMRYHFHAEDGSSCSTEAEGEGMDSGDKSTGKAMSIAHKYALLQALCVPTEDIDDPDGESHELAQRDNGDTPEQYVAKATDWINSQMSAEAINHGWSAELENFLRLPESLKAKLQKVRDDRLAFLTKGAEEKPDEREAWVNKQIAWIEQEPSLQVIQKFWKDSAKLIAGLETYQLQPLERAKDAAKRRITGISGPKVDSKPLVNLDDEINF